MRKVGIVTYYSIANYGSVLQAFALKNAIQELKYEPILIDYANMEKKWNRALRYRVLFHRAIFLLFHPNTILNFTKTKKEGLGDLNLRSSKLSTIFNKYIEDSFVFPQESYVKSADYYAFISGSDQVWQLSIPGLHYVFFLRFCGKEKRIAYAASFGTSSVPSYNKSILHKYLSGFSSISVRENYAVDVVKQFYPSSEVIQVLDPVLLYDDIWWSSQPKDIFLERKYSLCYFLGSPEDYIEVIRKYTNEVGHQIVWVSTGYEINSEEDAVCTPSPSEFLGLIKNAESVFTDSLHGTEFAITFKKQFVTFKRKYKVCKEQHSRIESLLSLVFLEKRLYSGGPIELYNERIIDYSKIDSTLQSWREKSFRFLELSLRHIKG